MTKLTIVDSHVLLGTEDHLSLTPDDLLRRMDLNGVETAIARPMGAELIVRNREGNDALLQAHPRIKAMVSVNPWWGPEFCLEELQRCRDQGAVGLFLNPARQGFFPTDSRITPLLELAEEFQWPVMFHTGTYIYADVLSVLERARQFPALNFIAGFGGFADMWFELPGVFSATENLYLDTSLLWGEAVQGILESSGASRLLFASAEPRNSIQVVLKVLERLALPETQRESILSGNAKRIFHLT